MLSNSNCITFERIKYKKSSQYSLIPLAQLCVRAHINNVFILHTVYALSSYNKFHHNNKYIHVHARKQPHLFQRMTQSCMEVSIILQNSTKGKNKILFHLISFFSICRKTAIEFTRSEENWLSLKKQ